MAELKIRLNTNMWQIGSLLPRFFSLFHYSLLCTAIEILNNEEIRGGMRALSSFGSVCVAVGVGSVRVLQLVSFRIKISATESEKTRRSGLLVLD